MNKEKNKEKLNKEKLVKEKTINRIKSLKDKSFSRSATTIRNENKNNLKFQEELNHIKSFVENLQLELKKHCLLSNEKNEFERIKKENIKLNSDVNILKDDMNELMKKYNIINEKINKLEGENEILKQQNKYLLDFINENNNNEELNKINNNILIKENNILNNFNSNNDMMFSNTQQSNNKLIDGEMSIFNNSNNEINKPIFNYYNKETNNSNVTDLSALTQMNYNLTHNQNLTPDRRKRYLIPKSE